MKFVKAHCGGNDFILLDTRKYDLPDNFKEFIQQIIQRRTGIGADGVIVIENLDNIEPGFQISDFRVRYFNPDGSEYGVCGDGSLCVLLYEGKNNLTFSTKVGIIKGYLEAGKAKVQVISPKELWLSIPLNVEDKIMEVNLVNIGVPHTVVPVEEVDSIDINKLAPTIRFHPYFGKSGTNVNFMQIINRNNIATRTYERSIEGETFSCGSGSCACAIVGWLTGDLSSPINLKTKGGDFRIHINGIDEIWLEGMPKIIYEGDLHTS